MIELLKLNGTVVFVNPDLIRFVESSPDTILIFGDGKTLLVKNKPQEVLSKIIEYRRLCVLPTLK
jgi:flagellar protein FlbD